jgi:hypothetical protein
MDFLETKKKQAWIQASCVVLRVRSQSEIENKMWLLISGAINYRNMNAAGS